MRPGERKEEAVDGKEAWKGGTETKLISRGSAHRVKKAAGSPLTEHKKKYSVKQRVRGQGAFGSNYRAKKKKGENDRAALDDVKQTQRGPTESFILVRNVDGHHQRTVNPKEKRGAKH